MLGVLHPSIASNAKKSGQLHKQRVQRRAELQAAVEGSDAADAPRLSDVVSDPPASRANDGEGEAATPRLGSDAQDAVMAALIRRRAVRPASEQWVEHTFERVVLAEARLRYLS